MNHGLSLLRQLLAVTLTLLSLAASAQTPPPYGLSINIEQAKKAMAAAGQALEDGLAANGSALRILAVPGITPLQGGLPIVVDGKIIGGIGVSGVLATQDEVVAKAGLDTLTAK